MEKIIKEHISGILEDTKIPYKYSGIYYISENFIDGVSKTFSISRHLVLYYLGQMVNKFVLDAKNDVMYVYNEFPEFFERNLNIFEVIQDLKKTKNDFVTKQNYHMAAHYREYEKLLEKSTTNKWDAWTEFINGNTD